RDLAGGLESILLNSSPEAGWPFRLTLKQYIGLFSPLFNIIDNSNSRGIVPLQDSDPSRRNNSFPGYRSRWGSMYRERELTRESCNFRLGTFLPTQECVITF